MQDDHSDRKRHERIGRLFAGARKLPAGERAAFLDGNCGDPALRAEVATLLEEDNSDALETGDMQRGLGRAAAAAIGAADSLPESIAHYRIIRLIGRGGMGEVYEAEQDDPRRHVTLKVVRSGLFGREHRARFRHEAQVLGRLRHPGIAQIYEAGTAERTENGQPYFAMELVDGEPLLEHARSMGLDTRRRLEMIALICDALHHAHQNGVIHRDLKPANILVEQSGQPKILDFGVARSTDADIRTVTVQTELGQLLGTIPYMSPEQASGDPAALDTRSDIYSVGVITYELLTGRLPYTIRDAMVLEAVRVIREEEPSRLGTLDRTYRGDVETIVARALEKEKERRYASAAEMAADIRRYLNDEPIVARPPSASYRTRKFVRRHRWGVAAATTGVVALVAFAATMAVQARRIAVERDVAQAAQADLESVVAFQSEMLSETDPQAMGSRLREGLHTRLAEAHRARGQTEDQVAAAGAELDTLLRGVNVTDLALGIVDEEILGRAVATIGEKYGDRPLIDARLRGTIGETYRALGRYEHAEPQLEKALEIRKRVLGDDHPDTLRSMNNLAFLYMRQGRYAEAEPIFRKALASQRRVLGDDHPDTLLSMNNLAWQYYRQGRFAEAEPLYLEALEKRRRVLGDDHPDTLMSMSDLGTLYSAQGRLDDTERLWLATLEGQKRVLGEDHKDTLATMGNVAILYFQQGRYDEAEALMVETLERQKRVLGEDHMFTLMSMLNLAELEFMRGRYDEAEALNLEALDSYKRTLGLHHPHTAYLLYNLAYQTAVRGNRTKALDWLEQSVEAGFPDPAQMAGDGNLESLHGPEFDALLDRVRQNAAAQRAE